MNSCILNGSFAHATSGHNFSGFSAASETAKIYRKSDGSGECVSACETSEYWFYQAAVVSPSIIEENYCNATCPPTSPPQDKSNYRFYHQEASMNKCVAACPSTLAFADATGSVPYNCLAICPFTAGATANEDTVTTKVLNLQFNSGTAYPACVSDCETYTLKSGETRSAAGEFSHKKMNFIQSTPAVNHWVCVANCSDGNPTSGSTTADYTSGPNKKCITDCASPNLHFYSTERCMNTNEKCLDNMVGTSPYYISNNGGDFYCRNQCSVESYYFLTDSGEKECTASCKDNGASYTPFSPNSDGTPLTNTILIKKHNSDNATDASVTNPIQCVNACSGTE